MKSIKIHDKAYVNGFGHRVSRNCKEVAIKELNITCDSVNETAERLGVSAQAVSAALNGRQKTVAGYHVYLVKEVTEHYDEVLEYNRNELNKRDNLLSKKDKRIAELEIENEKNKKEAALWRAHVAEQETIRKAKEMEHERLRKAVEDAEAEQERLNNYYAHLDREMQNIVASMLDAEEKKKNALEELMKFEKGE